MSAQIFWLAVQYADYHVIIGDFQIIGARQVAYRFEMSCNGFYIIGIDGIRPSFKLTVFFAPVGLVSEFNVHTTSGATNGILNGRNKPLHILPERRIDGCT